MDAEREEEEDPWFHERFELEVCDVVLQEVRDQNHILRRGEVMGVIQSLIHTVHKKVVEIVHEREANGTFSMA